MRYWLEAEYIGLTVRFSCTARESLKKPHSLARTKNSSVFAFEASPYNQVVMLNDDSIDLGGLIIRTQSRLVYSNCVMVVTSTR